MSSEDRFRRLDQMTKDAGITRCVIGGVIANNSSVLILRRRPNDFMEGIYELPSGKVDNGETLDGTLEREVAEETGLKVVSIGSYLGHFDYTSLSGKTTRQHNFIVNVEDISNVVLSEHDAYVWCDKENLKNYNITDPVRDIIEQFYNLNSNEK